MFGTIIWLCSSLCTLVVHLPAVCTVQLSNTWRQTGLRRGFVDYSENGEHTDRYISPYIVKCNIQLANKAVSRDKLRNNLVKFK